MESTGPGPVVSHVYANSGSYRVRLTVTDQRGFQDSEEKTFNSTTPVQPTPTPTQVPPTAIADQHAAGHPAAADGHPHRYAAGDPAAAHHRGAPRNLRRPFNHFLP